MASDDIEQSFKALLKGVADLLKPFGFSKSGTTFRRMSSGNAALISAQRSQFSSNDTIRFTFNIAVVSGRLLREEGPDITKAGVMYAHLSERIGEFLIEPTDKWWELKAASDPAALLTDLAKPLELAAQFLINHADDAKLIALWESGQSPGLTDGQRRRFLQELKAG
ncbi:DUF4304 domain-containing protein [Caulobacter sp. ErkDOM-E]|uniref:DUF4304 domain-containing protein n=1 Tax=Caulobacter sp. ErkDOM-E TaxID=3402778 RepID=UPI003AF8673A